MKKRVLISQVGRRNSYLVASILARNNLLLELHTTFWRRKKFTSVLYKIPILNYYFEKQRRYFDKNIGNNLVKTYFFFGIFFKIFGSLPIIKNVNSELNFFIKLFNKSVSKKLKSNIIVYSLSDSIGLFDNTEKNIIYIHEHVNCIRRFYEFVNKNNDLNFIRKYLWNYAIKSEDYIIEKANYIICPSKTVLNYLIENRCNPKKLKYIPYFIPNWAKNNWHLREIINKEKIKFLYVGKIHSIKGIHELIEAFEDLIEYDIELNMIGQKLEKIKNLPKNIKHFDHMDKMDLINYYNNSHIFILPSHCEGSALVSYEAIGFGLGIITTEVSGTIYEDGVDGEIISGLLTSKKIKQKIIKFIKYPELIRNYSLNTKIKLNKYDEDAYEKKVLNFFNNINE